MKLIDYKEFYHTDSKDFYSCRIGRRIHLDIIIMKKRFVFKKLEELLLDLKNW